MAEKITKDNAPKRQRGPGGPGPRGMTNTERAKDFKGTLRKLINYLGTYRMAILLVAAFAVASTVFTFYLLYLFYNFHSLHMPKIVQKQLLV